MTRPVVLFDLDYTLVRCDSFAGFTRFLLTRRWWRVLLVVLAAPAVVPLALFRRTRLVGASLLVWVGTMGLSDVELGNLMVAHVEARFHSSSALVCRAGVDRLCQHQTRGDRVVVVTGAAAHLAACVCASIGVPVDQVEIVGSRLERRWGGYIAGEHCYGPHKVRMLARMGIAAADCVYTDSASDVPLLQLGAHRVLVNATPRHRQRIASALGGQFEVVTWS